MEWSKGVHSMGSNLAGLPNWDKVLWCPLELWDVAAQVPWKLGPEAKN